MGIKQKYGRLRQIRLRPFAKVITAPEIVLLGNRHHDRRPGDRRRCGVDNQSPGGINMPAAPAGVRNRGPLNL